MKINIELDSTSNIAVVSRNVNGIKVEFEANVEDLFSSIMASKVNEESEYKAVFSPLREVKAGFELIQTIQIGRNVTWHMVKVSKRDVPFYIYQNFFGMCGMPELLFGIKSVNGFYSSMSVSALKESNTPVTRETEIFTYPFSNTSGGTGRVCTGANIINKKIDSLDDLERIIHYFFEMPNTAEMFRKTNNSLGFEFRELATLLEGTIFDDELLVRNTTCPNYNKLVDNIAKQRY